jgi:transcriptional regulator with XRE-family HTH domain
MKPTDPFVDIEELADTGRPKVKRRKIPVYTAEDEHLARIVRLRMEGRTHSECAKELGISELQLSETLRSKRDRLRAIRRELYEVVASNLEDEYIGSLEMIGELASKTLERLRAKLEGEDDIEIPTLIKALESLHKLQNVGGGKDKPTTNFSPRFLAATKKVVKPEVAEADIDEDDE